MPEYKKKLIEVALPLPEINDASSYDKMPGIGPHPKGIHHWWARLPLPTARAVLFASVVDDPSSNPDKFPTEEAQNAERERLFEIIRRMMQKKLHEHPEVYEEARQEMLNHCNGKLPPVLDPFAGGGSIPLEANRMGFEAHAADLNPVAVLLNKCNLEIIPRWNNCPPVNPEASNDELRKNDWKGARGLAEDVRYYGRKIREKAIEKIGHLYPKVKLPKELGGFDGQEADVIAWLWAKAITCPNPSCKAAMPLVRSFWLARKKPKNIYASPILNYKTNSVSFDIHNTGNPIECTTSGKGARCLFCNSFLNKEQVRESASKNGIREIPLAVVVETKGGRTYLSFTKAYDGLLSKPHDAYITQDMTNDRRWFSPPIYGLPFWSDIFSTRQLTAMLTFSDLIKQHRHAILADAKASGLDSSAAESYANAVTTFLGLALDRCADFNNSLCRWKPSGEQTMQLFARQAIPMVWDFAEPNILGEKAVCWLTAIDICADALERIATNSNFPSNAYQTDAASPWNEINNLLISTDPPYYDNIGYAALSDFFYVWLRRTVGDLYPDIFSTILVPKTPELTAAPERFDGSKEKAKEHFEAGFKKTFAGLKHKMAQAYPLTVYYAFKQEDEKEGDNEEKDESESTNGVDRTTGWETLLEALISSGFEITATWPVRASQKWRMVAMGTNSLASYIVLACRPRKSDASQCSRREFLSQLKRELPAALKHLQQGNIAPVDLAQASIGPGMAIFSRYSHIIESSGKPMTVRTALSLINRALDEVLAEQEGEFDADTRWAVAWFDQHGMDVGPFGEANVLCQAKNTAVNGLVDAGILHARGGIVRLLGREELKDGWEPASDRRLSIWEATQYLIKTHVQAGETGAAELLQKLGSTGEVARDLAYRLFKVCERKGMAQEAQVYNGLVIAWPEISRLASAAKKPLETEQTTLL